MGLDRESLEKLVKASRQEVRELEREMAAYCIENAGSRNRNTVRAYSLFPQVAEAYRELLGHEPLTTIIEIDVALDAAKKMGVAAMSGACALATLFNPSSSFILLPFATIGLCYTMVPVKIPPSHDGKIYLPSRVQPHKGALTVARESARQEKVTSPDLEIPFNHLIGQDIGHILTTKTGDPGYFIEGSAPLRTDVALVADAMEGRGNKNLHLRAAADTVALAIRRQREGKAVYKTLLA